MAHTKCEMPVKYLVDITYAQVYFMDKLSGDKYFGVVNRQLIFEAIDFNLITYQE